MSSQIVAASTVALALAIAAGRVATERLPRLAAPGTPPEWTLREELRFGGDGSAGDDIVGLAGIAVSRSGVVYALAGREITAFASGARPRRLTTPGADSDPGVGPPVSIGWLGDTLWVYQPRRTVILMDTGGKVIRRLTYRGTAPASGLRAAREMALGDSTFIAMLADGSFLRTMAPPGDDDAPPPPRMLVLPLPASPDTSVRATTLLVRAGADGEAVQGLEILAGPWSDARVTSPYGDPARLPQPFQDHPLVAVAPGGTEVIVVERYAPDRPGRAAYSVIRFHSASWKRTAHHFPYEPALITTSAVDSAVARIVDGPGPAISSRFLLGFPSRAAAIGAIRSLIRRPTHHSPVTDVVAGADRTVWLLDRVSGRWIAHSADGRVVGSVAVPAGTRLLHADAETMWAVSSPSGGRSGSPVLIRYRIVRR